MTAKTSLAAHPADPAKAAPVAAPRMAMGRWNVFVARRGNSFMIEIAELFCQGVRDNGGEAFLRHDEWPQASDDALNLVVAPHEFYDLHAGGYSRNDKLHAARHCLHLTTEQPKTPWFNISWQYASRGPLVLDMNRLGAAEYRRRGYDALYLPLGYHPSLDCWGGPNNAHGTETRPLDIAFLGQLTPRRERILATLGASFQPWQERLLLSNVQHPLRAGDARFLQGRSKYEFLRGTRVLLNLHRGDEPYFEWHRIIEAMANGAVVLTEPSSHFEPLRPGEHFVECDEANLPAQLESLLCDEAKRARIAQAAHDFVRDELQFSQLLGALWPAIFERSSRGNPAERAALRARCGAFDASRFVWRTLRGNAARVRNRIVLRGAVRAAEAVSNAKRQAVEARTRRRQAEALEAERQHGDAEKHFVIDSHGYATARPQVSVVLTAYNYGHLIGEAANSVLASNGVDFEIVLVDDASRDDTAQKLDELLRHHAEAAIRVVRHAANQGLARARNTGFEQARAPYVFVLDADNAIYPRCLSHLKRVLDASESAFAYPIIQKFGDETGLLSATAWSLEALLQGGNYIDAMAMVRRECWRQVGGYRHDLEAELEGWEDYALWLNFAERGWTGEICPQILARYRTHSSSMLRTVTVGTWEQQRQLVSGRFAALREAVENGSWQATAAPRSGIRS